MKVIFKETTNLIPSQERQTKAEHIREREWPNCTPQFYQHLIKFNVADRVIDWNNRISLVTDYYSVVWPIVKCLPLITLSFQEEVHKTSVCV